MDRYLHAGSPNAGSGRGRLLHNRPGNCGMCRSRAEFGARRRSKRRSLCPALEHPGVYGTWLRTARRLRPGCQQAAATVAEEGCVPDCPPKGMTAPPSNRLSYRSSSARASYRGWGSKRPTPLVTGTSGPRRRRVPWVPFRENAGDPSLSRFDVRHNHSANILWIKGPQGVVVRHAQRPSAATVVSFRVPRGQRALSPRRLGGTPRGFIYETRDCAYAFRDRRYKGRETLSGWLGRAVSFSSSYDGSVGNFRRRLSKCGGS